MRGPSAGPAAELFEEGWSRVRGRGVGGGAARQRPSSRRSASGSLGRASQMARAATGGRPAVFKYIRTGGCHTPAQLRSQLTYLTTKSTYLFDARGEIDGRSVLTPTEIADLAERFSDDWNAKSITKLGHTAHLLMSFPIGTKPEAVREVAREVCREQFQGDGAHFDYMVAVHTDRAHPHAHIVLNRRSPDGELFYIKQGHHFTFDLFREAMVEHGDRYGLRLEATRRLDRGHTNYAVRSNEVQQAREAGHEPPPERPRKGRELEQARQHVAHASATYRGLAAIASEKGFEQVSQALLRASLTLANNGVVLPTREIVMADTRGSFDGLVQEFGRSVQALEERIATVSPAQRPRLEQGLTEALASVASLNPIGEGSATLTEAPSTFGLYSQGRIEREALGRLDDQRVMAAVDAAVQGTGLSASEVLSRIRVGADNAALEDHWHASDLQAVGRQLGENTARPDAMERALDRLEGAYTRIDVALQEVGVLREARAVGDTRERTQEVTVRGVAQAVTITHPAQRADERAASLAAAGSGLDGRTAPRPVEARAVEAQAPREVARDPLVDATAARARDQLASRPVFGEDHAAQAQPFREALERQLGADELSQLRQGDSAALARITPDRASQQALAKAYLESDATTRDTPIHHRVLREIVSDQMDAQRARYALEDAREEAEQAAAAAAAARGGSVSRGAGREAAGTDDRDPVIVATAARVREQSPREAAFRDPAQARVFNIVIEHELTGRELAQLRQGDEAALSRLSNDRMDRLALAKAYLESDPTTRDTPQHHRVLGEIVSHRLEEQRERDGHEEEGPSHG